MLLLLLVALDWLRLRACLHGAYRLLHACL